MVPVNRNVTPWTYGKNPGQIHDGCICPGTQQGLKIFKILFAVIQRENLFGIHFPNFF